MCTFTLTQCLYYIIHIGISFNFSGQVSPSYSNSLNNSLNRTEHFAADISTAPTVGCFCHIFFRLYFSRFLVLPWFFLRYFFTSYPPPHFLYQFLAISCSCLSCTAPNLFVSLGLLPWHHRKCGKYR